MQQNINEIEINGIKYVLKSSVPEVDRTAVIVRCESAGCFFGSLVKADMGLGIVTLSNARRLWYWSGAASLSQLAVDGTSKPKDCKFPVAVPCIELAKVIEVIPCTAKAVESLSKVPVWSALWSA